MSILSRILGRVALTSLVVAGSLGAGRAAAGTAEPTVARSTVVERATVASDRTGLVDDARGHYAATPTRLEGGLLAYPPSQRAAAHPMALVYLHGAHGRAANGCPWFRGGSSELGWLVCPEGAVHEESGAASWGGDVFAQAAVVAQAERAAEAQGASTEPGVAIGFSQGGYVALDLVKARLGKFRGLVLIAAPEAHPSAQKLHDAGVVRVALASGALDGAHDDLVRDTQRLVGEGMDARFFDLGAVGHTYAAEDSAVLRDAIAWAAGGA